LALDLPAALAAALEGAPLTEALDLRPEHVATVRRQAEALYDAGKWAPCITALEVLTLLGDVRPFDALMRARAHAELGQPDLAERWREAAQRSLAALDAALDARDR